MIEREKPKRKRKKRTRVEGQPGTNGEALTQLSKDRKLPIDNSAELGTNIQKKVELGRRR